MSAVAISPACLERLRDLSLALSHAQRPIRVLRAIAWPDQVMDEFFVRGARELPRVEYEPPRFDLAVTRGLLRSLAIRAAGEGPLGRLIADTCESFALAVELLGAVGTQRFFDLSSELYGRPLSVSCDGKTTNLALAEHVDRVSARYQDTSRDGAGGPELSADAVAAELEQRLTRFFAGHAIRVEVVDSLAANAVAGADVVKLKRTARFSPRDIELLSHHEGQVHIATTLNGRAQPHLACLGTGAPRTTRTQEGLAIFAELLSQSMDLARLRRLADRVLAIRMAEEGASFLDLYRFFLDRGHDERAAFDCARRVCRGGLLGGGAPFTKDVVYLDGLVRVTNFLRVALTRGRSDFVSVLFAGKLDLADIPVLAHMMREGILAPPRYLPAWARDRGFLTAFMSYSAFLNETDLDVTRAYYEELIALAEASFPQVATG